MNKILETTKYVMENSELVKINHEKIIEFANNFNSNKTDHWLNASPFEFSYFTEQQKLHFLFIFHSICFSFWGEPKWTIEYKNKKYDGSWGMLIALGRSNEENVPITNFEYLVEIKKNDFANILKGNIEIPLFEIRYKILQEISSKMIEKFEGKAINLIKEANNDAQKLLELFVQNFPSFKDISTYKGKEIYFHKRAQLLVKDIYKTFYKNDLGKLKNMDQITAFADYKLPQILQKFEILEYSQCLNEKIYNKIEIAKESCEEIEIRANTIWAVEFIKEKIKNYNPQITTFEINDSLWLASQENNYNNNPYHLTRTTTY